MPRGSDLETLKASLPPEWADVPILSYSQVMAADRCSFSWYIGYHLGLRSEKRSAARDKGSFTHALLHSMYQAVMSGIPARDWVQDRDGLPSEVGKLLDDMKYQDQVVEISGAMKLVERYAQTDVLAGHTAVGSEQHFFVLVTAPSGRKFILQGYIDLITIDARGSIVVWDHKVTGRFWTPIQIMMDSQLPTYQLLLRADGIPVHSICINQLNSYDYKDFAAQTNEKLFRREFSFRSEVQLNSIWQEFLALADFVLDLYEGRQVARRSLRKDCSMCDMNGPCHDSLSGTPIDVAVREYNGQQAWNRSIKAGESVEILTD